MVQVHELGIWSRDNAESRMEQECSKESSQRLSILVLYSTPDIDEAANKYERKEFRRTGLSAISTIRPCCTHE